MNIKYPILKTVLLSELISDSSLQHRVIAKGNEYSEDYLCGLAENIKLNGLKKPIQVVEMEEEDFNPVTGDSLKAGDLVIVDGFHRKESIARLGYEKSEVEIVKKGSFADAAALSCSANADNEYSRRRGTGDIKQAIKDYIDFLKADSVRTGKKLFVFRYAKWAELFKCTEKTLHNYDFVREFRNEVKSGERKWVSAQKKAGKSASQIVQDSTDISHSGEVLTVEKVKKIKNNGEKTLGKEFLPKKKTSPLKVNKPKAPAPVVTNRVESDHLIADNLHHDEAVAVIQKMTAEDRMKLFNSWKTLSKAMKEAGVMTRPYDSLKFVDNFASGRFEFKEW